MTEDMMAAGQAGSAPAGLPGASPQGEPADGRAEPVVHYAYLGLAILLYATLAGWCHYHVDALARRFEIGAREIPAFSKPIFAAISTFGWLIYLPAFAFLLVEIVLPRRLTRVWLAATLILVLAGIYVAIALWLPARSMTS